jgi:hypothetical protein
MSQTKLSAIFVKTTPTSAPKKRSLEEYQGMTPEELIAALQERDTHITKLERECKRLKTVTTPTTATTTTTKTISPEQLQSQTERLRKLMCKGIKSQMKWKPSCKHGRARFSYEGICDEPTFRALMKLDDKDKTKGKRMEPEKFQGEILEEELEASIRYGALYLRGNVNVSYSQDENTIKVTGGYGM